MSKRWFMHRTLNGNTHMFGSRLCFGKFEKRRQVLISPRLSRGKRWSFGWGPRP